MIRRPGLLLPLIAAVVFALACKKPAPQAAAHEKQSPGASSDGWTTFDDADFRVSVPPADMVKRSSLSYAAGFPEFMIDHKDSRVWAGTATFAPHDRRSELMVRDVAELELKDIIAYGGKILAGVHAVPMRTGACAAFTAAASAKDCVTDGSCGNHLFIAYCDSPLKQRYVFIGNLGASDPPGQRPPNFTENSAAFERILRSIEFKKSGS